MENKTFKLESELVANKPNANGVIYPRSVLEAAVKEYNERQGGKFGEFALEGQGVLGPQVSLKNASHEILGVELTQGGKIMVEVRPLSTPTGAALAQLIQTGVRVAMRGVGATNDNKMVMPGFKVISFDIVKD